MICANDKENGTLRSITHDLTSVSTVPEEIETVSVEVIVTDRIDEFTGHMVQPLGAEIYVSHTSLVPTDSFGLGDP